MGSDFRPHGCDPMGSAVGISPIVSYDVDDKQALVLAGHVAGLPCIYTCMCEVLGCKSQHIEALGLTATFVDA